MMTLSASSHANSYATSGPNQGHRSNSDSLRSREIIKREFVDAGCLVTIGLDRVIIAPEDGSEFAADKFQKLMEASRELANAKSEKDSRKPLLAWVVNASETIRAKAKARQESKLLQSCLQNLEKRTADWLAERAIFIIAHADEDWVEQSDLAKIPPLRKYQASKSCNADVFFRSIQQNDEWGSADVITAFPRARRQEPSKFFSHYPSEEGGWEQGPVAAKLQSDAKKRNSFFRRICRIRRSDALNGFDKNVVSKFFDDGFTIFKLEEVVRMKIT
ncbi:MAG: hypothetical protein ACR2RE_12810 [Geminicoccaceae bacterium]